MRGLTPLVLAALAAAPAAAQPYEVEGDAIPRSLTGRPGDPARGLALMADRQRSLCSLCHAGPFAPPHQQGTLAPDLQGIGARLNEGQLRLRVVDMKRLVPDSIMPSYVRTEGFARVAAAWQGRPVLTAVEIEDVIAYLATLRE
ncbi:sulfur oxidation c-type cytochrome SoxX [Inquilinus limosus]|uniref:Cytochrome C n=1 Tax=Inquilinus limosus MP06 TaxID=1398085 RepID=A0A0A0CX20_9PROT|nr:sulfur oxidation c-type cytochrome SoxX [Inquilinus limosus]KGM30991.1 cytochrome C [Inquilinus limosus MP06]